MVLWVLDLLITWGPVFGLVLLHEANSLPFGIGTGITIVIGWAFLWRIIIRDQLPIFSKDLDETD